jgi:hypothetical protein
VRNPGARGRPIDAARVAKWLADFSGFQSDVTASKINRWLDQFHPNDRDIAARLLDAVEFYSPARISDAFRRVLPRLPGWSADPARRKGRWLFVPYAASGGESGGAMLHSLRRANGLSGARFNSLFPHAADLATADLGPADTVIFVDDIAGSGDQAVGTWERSMAELLPRRPRSFLVLVAGVEGSLADAQGGVDQGIRRIERDTPLIVYPYRRLRAHHDVFAAACTHFTTAEKRRILSYCEKADPDAPRGYGNCGTAVVMAHGGPNDSLPILHSRKRGFRGLFPRSPAS